MDELPGMVTFFNEVPDPRVERTRRHRLVDVLMMVLIGTIFDCKGWDAIHQFFVDADDYFEALLELPSGVPSADTLRRVMGAIDPSAFRKVFIAWANQLCRSTAGKLVAIDGKTVRGALAGEDGRGALHLINAWVCENESNSSRRHGLKPIWRGTGECQAAAAAAATVFANSCGSGITSPRRAARVAARRYAFGSTPASLALSSSV